MLVCKWLLGESVTIVVVYNVIHNLSMGFIYFHKHIAIFYCFLLLQIKLYLFNFLINYLITRRVA